MYVESVPNRASPPAILLRESFRDGGRVKKRTLANLSKLPPAAIDALRRSLRGEKLVSPHDAFTCCRSLPHGHVAAVLNTGRKLGLPALLARSPGRLRDLVLALLVARVIDAQSKLATARALTPESAVSTLGEMLDLGTVDSRELYAAMDWLVERQAAIEQRLAKRHLQEHTLVLYDLTSSYVEGTHCELARRGHSRDGKKGTLQIVFGLLCTATGCPVAVEVFEGSTSDPNTVAAQLDKLRTRFGLHRVVLVGDRGMLTAARIREDLADVDGLRWITTLRAPTIRKLVAAGTVTPSLFDERDLAEVTSEDFPGERLIVCRNPLQLETSSFPGTAQPGSLRRARTAHPANCPTVIWCTSGSLPGPVRRRYPIDEHDRRPRFSVAPSPPGIVTACTKAAWAGFTVLVDDHVTPRQRVRPVAVGDGGFEDRAVVVGGVHLGKFPLNSAVGPARPMRRSAPESACNRGRRAPGRPASLVMATVGDVVSATTQLRLRPPGEFDSHETDAPSLSGMSLEDGGIADQARGRRRFGRERPSQNAAFMPAAFRVHLLERAARGRP